jgi:hypothetical protein
MMGRVSIERVIRVTSRRKIEAFDREDIAATRRKSVSRPSSSSAASGSRTLPLDDDWSEFLRALISTGTRFLLIGGHAIAVHAEPSEDVDVFKARRPGARADLGFGCG